MRNIKEVILHCSDSTWGTVEEIDRWHKVRGWSGIGYHFVILNGFTTIWNYHEILNGAICPGRPVRAFGAHCKGHNSHSIGICLIGKDKFTSNQFQALTDLLDDLKDKYGDFAIYGHNYYNRNKTCPNFPWEEFTRGGGV